MIETASAAPTRREFVTALAVLAAATGGPAVAQEAKLPDAKSYGDALDIVIRYRFGKHLSEEQLKRVHASALRGRASADAMKNIELANGEDPIAAFRADLP
jgi:hypothetical protein